MTDMQKRAKADELVRELVEAIRNRQMEQRGENLADANAYTLGYLSSILISVVVNSPKQQRYLRDSLAYVKENA
jgi:hypothetical protein